MPFLTKLNLNEFNNVTALIRLSMALVASGILGLERTRKLRPAGMRTYMLVCIASCSVMLGGLYLYKSYGPGFDPALMASQVVSGIVFIGAGTIMVTPKQKVKGLTTAAGLGAVACLGSNIGVGNYIISIGVFIAMLITMFLADKLEVVYYRHLKRINVCFLVRSLDCLPAIRDAMQQMDIFLSNLDLADAIEGEGVSVSCTLRMQHHKCHKEVTDAIEKVPGVLHVERLDI